VVWQGKVIADNKIRVKEVGQKRYTVDLRSLKLPPVLKIGDSIEITGTLSGRCLIGRNFAGGRVVEEEYHVFLDDGATITPTERPARQQPSADERDGGWQNDFDKFCQRYQEFCHRYEEALKNNQEDPKKEFVGKEVVWQLKFKEVDDKGELQFDGVRRKLTKGGVTGPWATFQPKAGSKDQWEKIRPGTLVKLRGTINNAIAGGVTDLLTGEKVPWGMVTVVDAEPIVFGQPETQQGPTEASPIAPPWTSVLCPPDFKAPKGEHVRVTGKPLPDDLWSKLEAVQRSAVNVWPDEIKRGAPSEPDVKVMAALLADPMLVGDGLHCEAGYKQQGSFGLGWDLSIYGTRPDRNCLAIMRMYPNGKGVAIAKLVQRLGKPRKEKAIGNYMHSIWGNVDVIHRKTGEFVGVAFFFDPLSVPPTDPPAKGVKTLTPPA